MRFVFIFLFLFSVAYANPLPNDCAIIATEANARLSTSAAWTRVLFIKFFNTEKLTISAHVMTVWQIHKGGSVLVYDDDGTICLVTHSQKAADIVKELNVGNQTQTIFEARFIEN